MEKNNMIWYVWICLDLLKKTFLAILTVLSYVNPLRRNQLSTTPLSCISMNNQECKVRLEIINVNSDEPVFIILVLKEVSAAVVVTISMTHMQKCVFLML